MLRSGPARKPYRFETDCIAARGEDIDAMRAGAREVTYRTMLRWCDLVGLAEQLGYCRSSRQGITLKGDWGVSYYKSTYRGRPCYFLVWSAIEYVFVR